MMKLSRKEFQKIINDVAGTIMVRHYRAKATYEDREELTNEWVSSGVSGGSCYDTDESVYYSYSSEEEESEFDDLDNILLEIVPNMNFLHYKKLNQIMKTDSRTESEYYGNSTTYTVKTIKVEDLWKFLLEYDLVEAK